MGKGKGVGRQVRMRRDLMPLRNSPTSQFRKSLDPSTLVNAIQKKSCAHAALGQRVENLCGVDVWPVIEGESDGAGDGAVVDYGADGNERGDTGIMACIVDSW